MTLVEQRAHAGWICNYSSCAQQLDQFFQEISLPTYNQDKARIVLEVVVASLQGVVADWCKAALHIHLTSPRADAAAPERLCTSFSDAVIQQPTDPSHLHLSGIPHVSSLGALHPRTFETDHIRHPAISHSRHPTLTQKLSNVEESRQARGIGVSVLPASRHQTEHTLPTST